VFKPLADHPGGMKEGRSAERRPPVTYPFTRCSRFNVLDAFEVRVLLAHPPGCEDFFDTETGGVAALNPRLPAVIPPGCYANPFHRRNDHSAANSPSTVASSQALSQSGWR
jgi:hypothetical protein